MEDFVLTRRVYYHDTDCGGIVYYANYLKYLEEARTEYFYSQNVDLKKLFEEGIWFVVAHIDIDYRKPARYQDMLSIKTRIGKVKYGSVELFQRIEREELLIVEARTVLVCVGNDFRPLAIPSELRKKFIPFAHK